ncbi:hypothetical protein BU16DRAFT_71437 [Lophium mytilinum]|uniref:Uncharacterized protein n=1 Tax=Lophium mytilinum TaxID=390894 RepID=A0A6A6QLT6_9PEZI|nr:hypothetical protein BU16DRAFT_71437 [Lophium mytilinum]
MAEQLVSWQTAFWFLPPIALNTMLQPSRRLCGFTPELHTYLCSSSIICAVDSVVVLIRLIFTSIHSGSFKIAVQATLDVQPEDSPQSVHVTAEQPIKARLRALERATFARWTLGFAIGALPQFIKLQSFSGVPWTQAWAWMYLANFFLIELLTLLDYWMRDVEETTPLEQPVPFQFDRYCGGLALVGHFALAVWTLQSLWVRVLHSAIHDDTWDDNSPYALYLIGYVISLSIIRYAFFFLASLLVQTRAKWQPLTLPRYLNPFLKMMGSFSTRLPNGNRDMIRNRFLGWTSAVRELFCWIYDFTASDSGFLAIRYLEAVFPCFACLILLATIAFLLRVPTWLSTGSWGKSWKESALLLPVREEERSPIRLNDASFTLSMFLVSLTLAVFWYSFCFDSEGTYKPDWTNRFG